MPPSSTELPTDWASRPGFSLTQADIEEFKAIIRSEYGVEMENQEAWNRVIELLNLYRNLLGPIPEDPESIQANIPMQTRMDDGGIVQDAWSK